MITRTPATVEIPDDHERMAEVAAMLREVGALPDEEGGCGAGAGG